MMISLITLCVVLFVAGPLKLLPAAIAIALGLAALAFAAAQWSHRGSRHAGDEPYPAEPAEQPAQIRV